MYSYDNIICKKCPLQGANAKQKRKTKHFTALGSEDSDIMFVLGSPDRAELSNNQPFAGLSSEVMYSALTETGINIDSVYVTYIVKCSYSDAHAPTKKDTAHCSVYLHKELKVVKPKVVCLFGSAAVNHFLSGKMVDLHGQSVYSDEYNCWFLPVYDPVYVSKFSGECAQFKAFVKDLNQVHTLVTRTKKFASKTKVVIADSLEKVKEITDILCSADWLSFDLETSGLDPFISKVLCISFSIKEGEAYVIPWQDTRVFNDADQEAVKEYFLRVFSSKVFKIAHNGKFDIKHLMVKGINVKNFVFDTMLAHYLLNADESHELGSVAVKYTNMSRFKDEMSEYIKSGNINKAPLQKLYKYAGQDADATFRMFNAFKLLFNEPKNVGLKKVFVKIVMPMALLLAKMELTGIDIDLNYANQIEVEVGKKIKILEVKMINDSDIKRYMKAKNLREFNFRSAKQLSDFLYGFLKLEIHTDARGTAKNIPKQGSTDAKTRMELNRNYNVPLLKLLEDHRKLQKFYTTYIVPFVQKRGGYVNPVTKRVHTSFLQHGTATGRLSSKSPNMQNIPKKGSEDGQALSAKMIRNMFIAKQGYIFIEADYSQIEFRVWAHASGDPKMIRYIKKEDVHSSIAAEIHGISLNEVTKLQRTIAKATVYGVMYGRGSGAISAEYGISIDDAFKIIQSFKSKFAKAFEWFNRMKAMTRKYGYVESLFRRRRYLSDIHSRDEAKMAAAERQAVNTPIQSSAFDIVSLGMLRLDRNLKQRTDLKADIILTIHDSVILEVKKEDKEKVIDLIVESLTNPVKLRVDFPVDVEVGKRLGEMKKYIIKKETT